MSLYKRLHDAQAAPVTGLDRRDSGMDDLRKRIHQQLIEELGPLLYDKRLTDDQISKRVAENLRLALIRERAPLSAADKTKLVQEITDDVLGYGPIDVLLRDETVSDILVNGPHSVYVEKLGVLEKTDVTFVDQTHLKRIIDKIVSQVGRRIDEASPLCDARLLDGSRVNAVIHPLAVGGPFLTIRKFGTERLQVDDLIRFKTLDPQSARFLQACIVGRLNIVVSGGSGTGKTTTLNVLSSFIPPDERIITVEDAKELQLHQDHVLALESRPENVDGKGEVTIRDLVKNTLRMRPDRIIVGECRGGEALDMLQAMNTGHDGSVTSVHANSPRDTLSRIETLVLMSGFDLPVRAIREQMSAALDLVVQMSRLRDGSRKITEITEVQGMEGDIISLQHIFVFDHSMGYDETGRAKGRLKATGVRPKFSEKLEDMGIKLPADIFKADKKQHALPAAGGSGATSDGQDQMYSKGDANDSGAIDVRTDVERAAAAARKKAVSATKELAAAQAKADAAQAKAEAAAAKAELAEADAQAAEAMAQEVTAQQVAAAAARRKAAAKAANPRAAESGSNGAKGPDGSSGSSGSSGPGNGVAGGESIAVSGDGTAEAAPRAGQRPSD